jgi:hypothetical protein
VRAVVTPGSIRRVAMPMGTMTTVYSP